MSRCNFRKYLAKHGLTQPSESTGHYSKHELDCTEAENQTNSLLERNQSASLHAEPSNQLDIDADDEDDTDKDSESELLLLNDPDSRRELMLRAVERRLQQH